MAASVAGHRIGEVARRTGLSVDTLRVWERRYGFPRPNRADSGIRLFEEDDVRRLLLVRRALVHGFRVGEVIRKSGPEITRILEERRSVPPPGEHPVSNEVAALLGCVTRYELVELRRRLREQVMKLRGAEFVREIASPLLQEIGDRWAAGTVEIRQEHLLSEALSTQLHAILAAHEADERLPSILLATLPGERHRLGLEMSAVYLAENGMVPHLLGVDAPPRQIVEAALLMGVDVVGISLASGTEIEGARPALRWIAEWLPDSIEIWAGGRGVAQAGGIGRRVRRLEHWGDVDLVLEARRRGVRS
jgi:DNA-binding transcriptional MerR regulator